MHITITGNLGSGKSTFCRYLSSKYGFETYSTGDVQRSLAQKLGMTTLELNLFMHRDPAYDKMIDDEVVKLAASRTQARVIFDSRMAWHFVPHSFKVFLAVDNYVAASRIYNDTERGKVESYSDIAEAAAKLRERAASERERFAQFYGTDYFDLSHYDLVVDTSETTSEQVAELVYREALRYAAAPVYDQLILLAPGNIFPCAGAEESIAAAELSRQSSLQDYSPKAGYAAAALQVWRYASSYFLSTPQDYPQLVALLQQAVPLVSVRLTGLPEASNEAPDQLPAVLQQLQVSDLQRIESLAHYKYRHYPHFLQPS